MNQAKFDKFVGYIIDAIKELPELQMYAVNEGSNAYELVVLPMAHMLYDNISEDIIDGLIDRFSMSDINQMGLTELISFGALHCVEYRNAQYTSGYITLCFTEKEVDYSITSGDTLKYRGLTFVIKGSVRISATSLTGPGEDGLYRSYPIYVECEDGGSVPANSLSQLTGAPMTMIKIEHSALNNGIPALDPVLYKQRITNSIYLRQLVSYASISNVINDIAPSVKRINIIGSGDIRMTRDTIYDINSLLGYSKQSSDFTGKLSGKTAENKNQAFKIMMNEPITSASLGSSELFLRNRAFELSDLDYRSLTDLLDYVLIESDLILDETFSDASPIEQHAIEVGDDNSHISFTGDMPEGLERLSLVMISKAGEWQYNVVKAIVGDIVELSIEVSFDISEGAVLTLEGKKQYRVPGGWLRTDSGTSVDPDVKEDWLEEPRTIRTEKVGEVTVLMLGDKTTSYRDLVESIENLRVDGEERFEESVKESLNPITIATTYPEHRSHVYVERKLLNVTKSIQFLHDLIIPPSDYPTERCQHRIFKYNETSPDMTGINLYYFVYRDNIEEGWTVIHSDMINSDDSAGVTLIRTMLEGKTVMIDELSQTFKIERVVYEPDFRCITIIFIDPNFMFYNWYTGFDDWEDGVPFKMVVDEQKYSANNSKDVVMRWGQVYADGYEFELRDRANHVSWEDANTPTIAKHNSLSNPYVSVRLTPTRVCIWRVRAYVNNIGGGRRYSAWTERWFSVGQLNNDMIVPITGISTGTTGGTSGTV